MIPEKWYIRVNSENRKYLLDYIGPGWSLTIDAFYYFENTKLVHAKNYSLEEHLGSPFKNFDKISFEDFVKYVINKEEDTIEETKTEDYSYLEPFLKLIE